MANLWEIEDPIVELAEEYPNQEWPEVPDWVSPGVDPSTVAAIVQGGCASGAYMPAVTYFDAQNTMREAGNDVTAYLAEQGCEDLTYAPDKEAWSEFCCRVLSCAVESWAVQAEDELGAALDAVEEDARKAFESLVSEQETAILESVRGQILEVRGRGLFRDLTGCWREIEDSIESVANDLRDGAAQTWRALANELYLNDVPGQTRALVLGCFVEAGVDPDTEVAP